MLFVDLNLGKWKRGFQRLGEMLIFLLLTQGPELIALLCPSTPANFGNALYYAFSVAKSEVYLQFALKFPSSMYSNSQIFAWGNSTTVMGGLKALTSGHVEVYLGNFATLVFTSTNALAPDQYCVIEMRIKIDDASGELELRFDGISQGTFSGDTKPGADTEINVLKWGNQYNGNTNYLDDIVINDISGSYNNSWPEALKVVRLAPTADAGTNQWTPSTGSDHYAVVDEVPPDMTDNLKALSSGLVEKFVLQDLPVEAKSIKVVQAIAFALKGSSNNPDRMKLGFELNGSDYKSSEIELATAQTPVLASWEYSPDTALVWGVDEINAAKLIAESAD